MWSYLLLLFLCAYATGLQVITTEGNVEGVTASDGDYYAFYGIPYGGPTEGNNRFKAPTAPQPYPGVLHATADNVVCAQPTPQGIVGVENCLTLNILTNGVTDQKPVLVWLNADEYTTSNNHFSYRTFVEADIVVVPMNFRLSVFGFLCLGVTEAPGNAGLKDVIQGLKWIQSNIANFGGDPRNVTIMGHGSGAAVVDLITLSAQSENLVHKVIALSGSALEPWAVAYDPQGYARLFGDEIGYSGMTNEDLAARLITTDLSILEKGLTAFKFYNNTPIFAPCIENRYLEDTILTDAPIDILKSGEYKHIPVMYGYTTREGTLRANEAATGNWLTAMNNNFTNFLQVDLNFANDVAAESNAIHDFYFNGQSIVLETIEGYLDYFGDSLISVGVIRAARERALTSESAIRLIEFGYVGTWKSDWPYEQIPLNGVKHGGLLNYIFDFDLRPVDEGIKRSMTRRFVTFTQTGSQDIVNVTTWLAITSSRFAYLKCTGGDGPVPDLTSIYGEILQINPHSDAMDFWNPLYEKYYVTPPPFSSSSNGWAMGGCFVFVLFCQILVKFFN